MTNLPRQILIFLALGALGATQIVDVLYLVVRSPGTSEAPPASRQEASDDALARTSLETLGGCYAVRYEFTEDGRGDFFLEDGVESMDVTRVGDGYLVRDFLVNEEYRFLHWTQEWTPLASGRWLLTVRSGDGALRYQSEGVWRFNQWEGGAAPAHKPVRDELRTDYDHIVRRNVMQFTADRWVHSEINLKVREDATPVASEVGWITYVRRDSDELCGVR